MRYVLHPDVTARAGRVGDTVTFMRGGRAISRRYVNPSNPKTGPQLYSRKNLIQAGDVWSTCTPTERAGWDALADAYYADKVDSLGNPAPWNGQVLCTATHLHRYHYGASPDTDAYLDPLVVIPSVPISFAKALGPYQIYMELSSVESYRFVRVRISPPMRSTDYAPNPATFRCLTLPDFSPHTYYHPQGTVYCSFAMGSSFEYATQRVKDLVNDDIICVEVLSLSESFVPCPSGPTLTNLQIEVG
jgi:hypothetical protein